MNVFNNPNLDTLRTELDAALKEIAAKHGIILSIGSMSYSSDKFTTRLTGNTKGAFKVAAKAIGGDIAEGTEFMCQGTKFTITGIKPNRPKFPYQAVNARGTRYKFSLAQVKDNLI